MGGSFTGVRSIPSHGAVGNDLSNNLFPNSGFFGAGPQVRRHGFGKPFHRRGFGEAGAVIFAPYWPSFGYEEAYDEAVVTQPAPTVVVVNAEPQRSRAPEAPAAKPQLIEVKDAERPAAREPLPRAVFILTSGERLEPQRFVLTSGRLSVTIGRQQRDIPLTMIDLDATLAANRERGIELRIPADRNEISLSF